MSSSPAPNPSIPSPQNLPRRDRPSSRPSSRSSLRSHSPSFSLDDPVHVRNQISTLKHSIRHQQAQLQSLENIIRAGPRPYSSDLAFALSMSSDDASTLVAAPSAAPSSYKDATTIAATKAKRRSSYEVLQSIAGPDSNLPLPKRVDDTNDDVIREGIPMSFGSPPGIMSSRRPSSPTRSLSRTSISSPPHPSSLAESYIKSPFSVLYIRKLTGIPVAAVGNAKALADDGHINTNTPVRQHTPLISKSHSTNDLSSPSSSTVPTITSIHTAADSSFTSLSLAPGSPSPNTLTLNPSSASLNPPSPSPRRLSSTPGGTTKVLADLQAGVINARHALENTKSQLRLSQRTVASLTRKVEDLKEVEERLRIENEGLNNVVARKERLLQEVLERARKAEAEATALKQQLKQETSTSKKTIREMESQLAESTALSKKSEREYITLRDSIKGMVESWKHDTESLRTEMRKREERWKKEVDGIGKKYRDLLQNVKEREKLWEEEFKKLKEQDKKLQKEVEAHWEAEIERLEVEVGKSGKSCEKAEKTAQDLAIELAILRKRMKSARIPTLDSERQPTAAATATPLNNTPSSTSTQQESAPP